MSILKQIRVRTNNKSEPSVRQSFLGKRTKKRHAIAGIAIFALMVLHFVSQFVLFRGANSQNELTLIVADVKETEQIKSEYQTEYKIKEDDNVVVPNRVSTAKTEPKRKNSPAAAALKKKEPPRESRAERLRRAEKILTGV